MDTNKNENENKNEDEEDTNKNVKLANDDEDEKDDIGKRENEVKGVLRPKNPTLSPEAKKWSSQNKENKSVIDNWEHPQLKKALVWIQTTINAQLAMGNVNPFRLSISECHMLKNLVRIKRGKEIVDVNTAKPAPSHSSSSSSSSPNAIAKKPKRTNTAIHETLFRNMTSVEIPFAPYNCVCISEFSAKNYGFVLSIYHVRDPGLHGGTRKIQIPYEERRNARKFQALLFNKNYPSIIGSPSDVLQYEQQQQEKEDQENQEEQDCVIEIHLVDEDFLSSLEPRVDPERVLVNEDDEGVVLNNREQRVLPRMGARHLREHIPDMYNRRGRRETKCCTII